MMPLQELIVAFPSRWRSFSMADEGRKILDEGIAQGSSDFDVVYIIGYGIPVSRGGPMFYADQQ